MTQQVKALTTKPANLSLIPKETHGRENSLLQVIWPLYMCPYTIYIITHTHMQIINSIIKKLK